MGDHWAATAADADAYPYEVDERFSLWLVTRLAVRTQRPLKAGDASETALGEAFSYLPHVPVLNDAGGQYTSYGIEPYLSPGSGTGCEVLAHSIDANVAL